MAIKIDVYFVPPETKGSISGLIDRCGNPWVVTGKPKFTVRGKFGHCSYIGNRETNWRTYKPVDYGVGTGDYTLEAWVHYNVDTSDTSTIQLSDVVGGAKYNPTYHSLILGGGACWYGTSYDANSVSAGWHHIALTRYNGLVLLYQDGKPIKTFAQNDTHDFSTMKYGIIGNSYNMDRVMNGYIERIRFSNHAVYTKEFTSEPFNKDKHLYVAENKEVFANGNITSGS